MSGEHRSSPDVGFASATRISADLIISLAALLTTLVTARLLEPSGRGELAVVVGIAGIASLIGNSGLAMATTYFAATNQFPLNQLLGNALVAGAGLGTLTAICAWLLTRLFTGIAGGVSDTTLAVGLAFLPFIFIELYLSFLIIGKQRLLASNVLMVAARVISALLIVIGLYIHPTVFLAVILVQSYSVIRLILNIGYMHREGMLVRPAFNWSTLRAEFGYGTKSRGNDIFQHLNMRFDILMLNAMSTKDAVGIYSIAIAISEFIWLPSSGIGWVLFPRTAGSDDPEVGARRAANAARVGLAVTFVLALLTLLIIVPLVPIAFGQAFASARLPLAILVSGGIFYSLSLILSSALAGRGIPQYSSLIAGTGLLVMLVLDLLLIPRWDVIGAAVASTTSYVASGILAAAIFAWKTEVTFKDCLVPRRADASAIGEQLKELAGRGANVRWVRVGSRS